ncbi:MAG: bifunctional 3-(3-hydroxy-phenyl)propionate/3-hydroxycinnamic acid hydroxylase [Acidobacteria bacterium]|nr:bifunctional 3-(3-hydroxy-phenyl)propionate/3-hydroxycinnamic acid hydroxylase [Acidobacteriota bacterium]
MTMTRQDNDVDVIIVGQGSVGLMLSLALAQRGHRVLAVERHTKPYALPRAVHYDPDVNRFLASLGITAQEQATFGETCLSYDWLTADKQLLLTFRSDPEGNQGWPDSTMFAQSGLEDSLRKHQKAVPTLDVRWGTELTAFSQDDDGVTATIAGTDGPQTVRAKFMVGADGANSVVRQLAGLPMEDLGFSSDWLVMDLKMPERQWVPVNGQICDPMRPTSCVSGGPGRRRFEFMLMPGDDPTTFATPQTAWRLAAPWNVGPDEAELERLAMYTFHARCVTRWSEGHVFIAGDAAHQMPPFFGRGMVSGVRDAVNLAWKLDHVLQGFAPLTLLDTYGPERNAHIQYALGMSLELGRLMTETDPEKAAERDAYFLAKGPDPRDAMPPLPPEILGPGFFPSGAPGDDPIAGRIGVQGRLRGIDGRVSNADTISWGEHIAFVDARHLTEAEAQRIRAAKPKLTPGKVIEIVPAGTPARNDHSGEDMDQRYTAVFDQTGTVAIVYRPDFHGFGSARTIEEAISLLAALDPHLIKEPA